VGPGDRRSRPERGPKNPWQLRPVHPIGPMHKSYSGAGRTQGTSRPRGQTPGAAANSPRRHPHWVSPANDETRGGEAGETACGCEASNDPRRRHPRTETDCEGSENPMSVAGKNKNFPARSREQPERGPGTCAAEKPDTNDPRGRRLQNVRPCKNGDARREKPQGRIGQGPGGPSRTNAAAGWSGGRHLPDGTARPVNAEGNEPKPHERCPPDLSA